MLLFFGKPLPHFNLHDFCGSYNLSEVIVLKAFRYFVINFPTFFDIAAFCAFQMKLYCVCRQLQASAKFWKRFYFLIFDIYSSSLNSPSLFSVLPSVSFDCPF